MPDPELLLLDEPAASLDLGARETLLADLADLAAEAEPAAIVLVTHHVEEIPAGFSHALVLRAGAIVASGPIDEVLTSRALSQAFDRRSCWNASMDACGRAAGPETRDRHKSAP